MGSLSSEDSKRERESRGLIDSSLQSKDDIIREMLVGLAEAVATGEIENAQSFQDLRSRLREDGSSLERLALFCLSAFETKLGEFEASRPPASLMNAPIEAQKAFIKLSTRAPSVGVGLEITLGTILESVGDSQRIHIIDFASWPQLWVVFLHRLSEKFIVPPYVRLTIVSTTANTSFVKHDIPDMAKELSEVASRLNIQLEVTPIRMQMENIHPGIFRCREGEDLVVNCNLYLHQLYDSSVLRFSPRDKLIQAIHDLNPKLFFVVDFSVNLNTDFFLYRVKNMIPFYEGFFLSIEKSLDGNMQEMLLVERTLLYEQMVNVIAFEGLQRWFRPETLDKMIPRFENVGLSIRPISNEVFKVVEAKMEAFPLYSLKFENGVMETCSCSGSPMIFYSIWRVMQ